MRKIAEMTMDELTLALCQMAEPASNIMSDGAVSEAFVEMGKKLNKKASLLQNIAVFTSVLVPVLLGEKHRDDTYAVLAALEGVTVEEIRKQNGIRTVKDLFEVFMINKQTVAAFRADPEVRAE